MQCRQSVQLLNVKLAGASRNQYALKGLRISAAECQLTIEL